MYGLMVFALLFRLVTLMMIHTGVDERDYWNSAKAISQGLEYPELSHRTNRFAIILPVAAAQLLLGTHPNVYYVLPILNVVLQAALAFLIGFRLKGRLTGFLASLSLIMFPYMIRAGSQVRPEVFSLTYLLLAFLAFTGYLERTDKQIKYLFLTGLWVFVAYQTKITNLFFLPGMVVAILVYKKNLKHAFLLCSMLLGMYLLETGAYALFTEYKFGMLEIITRKHFSIDDPFILDSFWGLFGRYSPDKLQTYWSIPFVLFAVAGIAAIKGQWDKRIGALSIAAFSFFLFITIEVKSFSPITPAEQFINRYFTAVLAPVFIVLAFTISYLLQKFSGLKQYYEKFRDWRMYLAVMTAGILLVLVISALPVLPRSARKYLNNPLSPETHPLSLNDEYMKAINEAYNSGVPIVGIQTNAGRNAVYTAASYYLDLENYIQEPQPAMLEVELNGDLFIILEKPGIPSLDGSYLGVIRSPFRLSPLAEDELSGLSGESFTRGRNIDKERPDNE